MPPTRGKRKSATAVRASSRRRVNPDRRRDQRSRLDHERSSQPDESSRENGSTIMARSALASGRYADRGISRDCGRRDLICAFAARNCRVARVGAAFGLRVESAQIALAASIYADTFAECFPGQPDDGRAVLASGGDGCNYYDALYEFGADPSIWLCPSTRDQPGRLMSYHMNGLIITSQGLSRAAIRETSRTLLVGESGQFTRFDEAYLRPDQEGNYLYDRPQHNHTGGSNATFVDGHVAWYHDNQWDETSFRVIP